jgi:3-hydroxymyristoyl/3-hydroxydecanoyl-(acyl carrier protein) dehydratase
MLAQGNDIFNLIPQRPPIVMVDKLFECNDQTALTGLEISSDNLFVTNGLFSESGLIENIAQSAAVMTGWLAISQTEGEQKIPMGVIGAVKDFQVYFLPEVNSVINTRIVVLYRVANATIINGKVKFKDKLVAEGELKIFTTEQA